MGLISLQNIKLNKKLQCLPPDRYDSYAVSKTVEWNDVKKWVFFFDVKIFSSVLVDNFPKFRKTQRSGGRHCISVENKEEVRSAFISGQKFNIKI